MAVTYTITAVNAKSGSIVLTPSVATMLPEYFLNLKSVKLRGNNPFLADNVTTNPYATVSLFCLDANMFAFKDIPLNQLTAIGGVPTPATLALTLAAIANLIAS